MSLVSQNAERAKFGYLLQLAQDQIQALEADDFFGFDRILAAKAALVTTMTDARAQLAADPSLGKVVTQIGECDKAALRLLYRKTGRLMREMAELQQGSKARRAYSVPVRHFASPALEPESPRFLDQKS